MTSQPKLTKTGLPTYHHHRRNRQTRILGLPRVSGNREGPAWHGYGKRKLSSLSQPMLRTFEPMKFRIILALLYLCAAATPAIRCQEEKPILHVITVTTRPDGGFLVEAKNKNIYRSE